MTDTDHQGEAAESVAESGKEQPKGRSRRSGGKTQGNTHGRRRPSGAGWNGEANPLGYTVKKKAPGYTGIRVEKEIALGNPQVRAQFTKRYKSTCRSIHFVLTSAHGLLARREPVFAQHQLDEIERRAKDLKLDEALIGEGSEGMLKLIKQAIKNCIDEQRQSMKDQIVALREVGKQYDLPQPDYGENVEVYSALITTPLANNYLAAMRVADELAGWIQLLWLEGTLGNENEDPDEAYEKYMGVHVKRPLMRIFHTVRDLYHYLHRRYPYLVADVTGAKYPELNPRFNENPPEVPDEIRDLLAEKKGQQKNTKAKISPEDERLEDERAAKRANAK